MDNKGSEGSLLRSGFLRDVKPQPTSGLTLRHGAIFSAAFSTGLLFPLLRAQMFSQTLTIVSSLRQEGGTAFPCMLGSPKIRAGGRSNSLTCKGLFRATSAEVWAGNS